MYAMHQMPGKTYCFICCEHEIQGKCEDISNTKAFFLFNVTANKDQKGR